MVHLHVTDAAGLQMVHVHVTHAAGDEGDMETNDWSCNILLKLTRDGATNILCLLTNAMMDIALKSKCKGYQISQCFNVVTYILTRR